MKPKVYIRKARSFGEIFGDTIGYIKQNFKPLFGSILLLVSPFVLLATILIIYLFKSAFANIAMFDSMAHSSSLGFAITSIIILYLLGYTAFITVLNDHMIINDSLPNNEKTQMKHIIKSFLRQYLRGLGSMVVLLLINIVLAVIVGLIFGVFALLIKASAVLGVILFVLFYIFFLLIVVPIMLYLFTAILFTSQRHKVNVFVSIRRVFANLKGNFWITWLLSFLGGMIIYILSIIVFLPGYIIFIISMLTRLKRVGIDTGGTPDTNFDMPLYLIILFCITGVLIVCIYTIYFVMMNLQCASLEEKKEGISIMEKIESI